ncbi:MAG: LysR family transcriptional regulator [Pseudomonadota bacterium]
MHNWDDLRFVVALARYGSMSQAAKHLNTNVATVSRRIHRINEAAGAILFLKGKTDWELTDEGRQVYDLASRFSDDLRTFSAELAEVESTERTVRITAVEFLVNEVLPQTIPDFLASHPNIKLEISASDQKLSLAYGEADIALRLTRPTEGRLVARRVADIPMGIWGTGPSKDWIGLPSELDWTPEMKNGRAFFGRPPALRVPSYRAILAAIGTTGLAGIAPALMAQKEPTLKLLQPEMAMRTRELWILFHETRKNDPIIRETSRWLETSFAKL